MNELWYLDFVYYWTQQETVPSCALCVSLYTLYMYSVTSCPCLCVFSSACLCYITRYLPKQSPLFLPLSTDLQDKSRSFPQSLSLSLSRSLHMYIYFQRSHLHCFWLLISQTWYDSGCLLFKLRKGYRIFLPDFYTSLHWELITDPTANTCGQ